MNRPKLLIVEDESIIAMDLAMRLRNLGYPVLGTSVSGEDAIRKINQAQPDLVLMDIKLRGTMDGIQTAEIVRDSWDIPIIYLTAFADEQTLQRAQITEPFGYLLKPVEEKTLSITIDMAMYKFKLEQQLRESEEKWRSLVENASNIITIVDAHGRIQYSNQKRSPNQPDPIGMKIYDFIAPEFHKVVQCVIEKVYNTGHKGQFEVQASIMPGPMRWLDTQAGPIIDRGQVIGVTLISTDIHERVEMQQALSQSLHGLERSNAFIAALGQVAARIQQNPSPEAILQSLGSELSSLGITCAVTIINEPHHQMEISFTTIPQTITLQLEAFLNNSVIGLPIKGQAQETPNSSEFGQPTFIRDAAERIMLLLPGVPKHLVERILEGDGTGNTDTMAYLPLVSRQQVLGGLTVWGKELREADMPSLQIFANQVAVAFDNARLFRETQKLSITDYLTGVFNRRHFMEIAKREFERIQRYNESFSLIMYDLDHFKLINDTYGHIAGDHVLQEVAKRTQLAMRSSDITARYGGEEFIILLPETTQAEAVEAANRLLEAIHQKPIDVDEQHIRVTASLGVVGAAPTIPNLDEMIQLVDQALYRAKAAGRDCVREP